MVKAQGAWETRQCPDCGGDRPHRRDNDYSGWTCTGCWRRNPDQPPPGCTVALLVLLAALAGFVFYRLASA